MFLALNKRLANIEAEINEYKVRRAVCIEQLNDLSDKIAQIDSDLDIFDKTRLFLQKVSDTAREQIKTRLEQIVTNALQAVRGQEYSFRVRIRPSAAGRPEIDFLTVTRVGDQEIESLPSLGKGGGVIDIISTTLKFAMLEIENNAGIIWMDEPFKFVSEEYVENASSLLQYMGETSGRQIIVITHNPEFVRTSNKKIKLLQRNGRAYPVQEVE